MKKPIFSKALLQQFNRENFKKLFQFLIASFIINLFVELLARRSPNDTVLFIVDSPLLFLYGILIIFFSLSLSLLFKRQRFWFMLFSSVWVALAVTDFILLTFRSMPLTASDIWLMSSVRDIFEKYLSHTELILIMLGISALLGLVFLLWSRSKKYQRSLFFAATHVFAIALLLFLSTVLLYNGGLLDRPNQFDNLPRAYHNNGFAYSFSTSLLTGGVQEPEVYTPDEVESIIDEQQELPQTSNITPNIVFVQLESFFDPGYMKDIEIEENPIPYFSHLKKIYPSGLLSVPAIGAGTANTEFEILTGMNLNHFGVGEYPYMTIVNTTSSESIASVLGSIGYETHAIHNNNATFYDRNIVYNNLGFDSFTSLEYMDDIELNPRGWAKDVVLTEEIMKALNSTKEKDFVFAVSVQPHGKYPTMPLEDAPVITTSGFAEESRQNGFEYYLGQLRECDAFVGQLTREILRFSEPTVVVFYGDHLPSFHIQQEELSNGTTQTTEYVLWANFRIDNIDRDLQTYQLAAYVMDFCNIHEGTIFRLHQTYQYGADDDAEYQDALSVLEYDAFYGENYLEEDTSDPPVLSMRFDVEDITIHSVTQDPEEENAYFIMGEHFTPYSRVMIDDSSLQTEFLSENLLRVTGLTASDGQTLYVVQVSAADELVILSTSEGFDMPITKESDDEIFN